MAARRSARVFKTSRVLEELDRDDTISDNDDDRSQGNKKISKRSDDVTSSSESSDNNEGAESEHEGAESDHEGLESETEEVGTDDDNDEDENNQTSKRIPSSLDRYKDVASSSNQEDDIVNRYFSEQAKSTDVNKIHKSLPKMDRKLMNQVLAKTPDPFKSSIKALYDMYKALHNYWLVQLSKGYNILLYGYGSKQKVIEDFCKANLSKECYLVVNGFFPGLVLKQILNELTSNLLEHSGSFKNNIQQCKFICSMLCEDEDAPDELFLIIHNIDGPSLRDERAQIALSLLATCPKVHIIATIDHLNSPLLWNEIILSRYNWAWHDATTFEQYTVETSYENSLLVQQSGVLAMSSLTHVLKSLPEKAQKIFVVLATHHLEHKEDSSYIGLPYAELYRICREKFLANSDITLRSQLTEFLDHKLIRSRKGPDGTETLSVLVKEETLQQFTKNQK